MTKQVNDDHSMAYVLDDNPDVREALSSLLQSVAIGVQTFGSAQEFIDITQRERAIPVQKIRECYEQLTPREREVMLDVTNGMMNKQIAHRLGLSEITIKVHRGSIVKKMEARSVAELVRQADMVKADYRTL